VNNDEQVSEASSNVHAEEPDKTENDATPETEEQSPSGAEKGSESPKQANDEIVAGAQTDVKVEAGKLQAKKLNVAKKIEEQNASIINNINKTFFSHEEARIEEISLKHFNQLEVEEIEPTELVFEKSEVAQLTKIVAEKHILFLEGEPELGKAMIARLVAKQLRQQKEPLSKILFSLTLDRNVIVKLDNIASSVHEYGHNIIIFKDAFASEHNDLIHFANELESLPLKSITKTLRENHIFIIFTSDLKVLKDETVSKLKRLEILHEMAFPSHKILTQGLQQQLNRFIQSRIAEPESAEQLRQNLTTGVVVEKLRTMPKIVRFIKEYSWEITEQRLSVEQALEQFENLDLKKWFLKDLANDFEAWSFVLALVLSYPSRDFDCHWIQFYQFQREILKFLSRELRQQGQEEQKMGLFLLPDEDTLLQKAHAEVKRLSYPPVDIIQFRDDAYPEQLWKVLFNSGRSVLTLLIPLLKELAISQDIYLQRSAAKALGRIGEMDRNYIIYPLIYECLQQEEEVYHVAAGYLFQGILGSADEDYHESCLRQLRHFLDDKTVRAGIITLLMMGRVNLGLTMRELKGIVAKRFSTKIDELRTSNKLLHQLEDMLISQPIQSQHNERLYLIAATGIFSETDQNILWFIQYCIVSLSFSNDPLQVLRELLAWMKEDSKNIAPLVGLLFIGLEGIADELEKNRISSAVNKKDLRKESRILFYASRNDESIQILTDFLEHLFISLSAFPRAFRQPLRSNFMVLLKIWAKDACATEKFRPTVEKILAALYGALNKELRDAISRLLREDSEFAEKGSKLRELAIDVLTRRPN
jgi:hypothetical protein